MALPGCICFWASPATDARRRRDPGAVEKVGDDGKVGEPEEAATIDCFLGVSEALLEACGPGHTDAARDIS